MTENVLDSRAMYQLSIHDRRRLSAEINVDRRTVDRWLDDPSTVNGPTCYALNAACSALSIIPTPLEINAR